MVSNSWNQQSLNETSVSQLQNGDMKDNKINIITVTTLSRSEWKSMQILKLPTSQICIASWWATSCSLNNSKIPLEVLHRHLICFKGALGKCSCCIPGFIRS